MNERGVTIAEGEASLNRRDGASSGRTGGVRFFARLAIRTASILALGTAVLTVGPPVESAEHPTLVDPAQAKCESCHEEVVRGKVVHAPAAEDCLSCHAFERAEKGFTVELAEGQPEVCLMCHDDMQPLVDGEVAAPHAALSDGCTGCHDPHSSPEEHLLVAPALDLCATCHQPAETDALHPIPVSRGNCLSCHAPHGSAVEHMLSAEYRHAPFDEGSCDACHRRPRGTRVRLQLEGGELCYACHGDLEKEYSTGHVHTAVVLGECTACHDPHLAGNASLLRASGADLCVGCHPGVGEALSSAGTHTALSFGCQTCHRPHWSEHPAQLLAEIDELCLSCHDGSDRSLRRLHLGVDLSTVRCTECHDPHGSSEPHLIAVGSVHPPFVEDCAICHDKAARSLVASGSDLCFACHDDIREKSDSATVPHAAMEVSECVDCHSPHASRQPRLLRAPGGGVCTTCHEEQLAAEGEVTHGAIDWIGCQSCHQPHGGDHEFLLTRTGNELCEGCHLAGEVERHGDEVALAGGFVLRGDRARALKVVALDTDRRSDHPIPDHPVTGTVIRKRGSDLPEALVGTQMTCLSCHESHAAASHQLFAYGAETRAELCTACHPK